MEAHEQTDNLTMPGDQSEDESEREPAMPSGPQATTSTPTRRGGPKHQLLSPNQPLFLPPANPSIRPSNKDTSRKTGEGRPVIPGERRSPRTNSPSLFSSPPVPTTVTATTPVTALDSAQARPAAGSSTMSPPPPLPLMQTPSKNQAARAPIVISPRTAEEACSTVASNDSRTPIEVSIHDDNAAYEALSDLAKNLGNKLRVMLINAVAEIREAIDQAKLPSQAIALYIMPTSSQEGQPSFRCIIKLKSAALQPALDMHAVTDHEHGTLTVSLTGEGIAPTEAVLTTADQIPREIRSIRDAITAGVMTATATLTVQASPRRAISTTIARRQGPSTALPRLPPLQPQRQPRADKRDRNICICAEARAPTH